MTEPTRVAVLGTGRMGAAMIGRLRRADFEVTVYNRSAAKAEAVADATGAFFADSAANAVAGADIVLSSLADDAAVWDVYTGGGGAANALQADAVVLETSTVDPRTHRDLEPTISAVGADLLDAPVSGSIALVEQGALTFMVGGKSSALEKANDVLHTLGSNVFHVGEVGAGATVKLAVNAIVHSLNVALAEALVLAEHAGVDRSSAYEVFAASAAAAPFVLYKRAAFENPDESPVAFSLDLVAKDLDLILELAAGVGAPMAQGTANRALTVEALEAGLGANDMSAIATYLRSLS